jgi:hypothetical protein
VDFRIAPCVRSAVGCGVSDRRLRGGALVVGPALSRDWPEELAPALLFVCCGMIWSGARRFHNRQVLPIAVVTGAAVWLLATYLPDLTAGHLARVVLSS